MKKYEITLTANATINLTREVLAPNPEKAKDVFIGQVRHYGIVSRPWVVSVIEPPIYGHDFNRDSLTVFEVEDDGDHTDTDVFEQITAKDAGRIEGEDDDDA